MRTARLFSLAAYLILSLPLAQTFLRLLPPQRLFGVQEEAVRPSFGWKAWAAGSFQSGMEKWFGRNYGLHDYLVKTNNQVLFSAFHDVRDKEGIVLGRDGQLLDDPYILQSLQFNEPLDFHGVISALVRLRGRMRARGKSLILFVTPSKSSFMPWAIPGAYRKFPHYAPDSDYRDFIRSAREAGLSLVDGRAVVFSAAATLGHPPFPRTGIHWNDQAAGLASIALLGEIERETGRDVGRMRMEQVAYGGPPEGSDRDYGTLLNLWSYAMPETGVHVRWSFHRGPFTGKVSGVFEGGSFLDKVLSDYSAGGFFKRLTYVIYNRGYLAWPSGPDKPGPVARLDWDKDVLPADFVVLEINEGYFAAGRTPATFSSGFLKSLLDHLGSNPD